MARAALCWGLREFAAAAKVSIDTVARFERGEELKERTIDALQRALEAVGPLKACDFVRFIEPAVRSFSPATRLVRPDYCCSYYVLLY